MLGSRVLLTAACLIPFVARAQPKGPQPPPPAVVDLVKQGIAKSQAGDHLGAIEKYKEAYRLAPDQYTLLSNIGTEYVEAGKSIEALRHFCMYLEKDPSGPLATYAANKAKTTRFDIEHKDVPEAELCTNLPSDAPPVKPTPKPTPTPKPPPVEPEKDSGSTLEVVGLATGVAGLAALGAGFYFGYKAKQYSDEITNHCPEDPCPPGSPAWMNNIDDFEARGHGYQTKQIIFLAAGGAAVVVGGVLFGVGRSKSRSQEQRTAIVPVATPTTAGFAISGRW
jgi:hypothetical protein